jgi:hypothetical protein
MLKKLLILISTLLVFLFGCSDNNSNKESNVDVDKLPEINKEFVEKNAKIGLSKEEVKDIFGVNYFSGEGETPNSEVWVFDRVKEGFEYEKSVQKVPFDDIRSGNVEYQLYINFDENKSLMYLYIYKAEDGQLRNYQVNPDGTTQEIEP